MSPRGSCPRQRTMDLGQFHREHGRLVVIDHRGSIGARGPCVMDRRYCRPLSESSAGVGEVAYKGDVLGPRSTAGE